MQASPDPQETMDIIKNLSPLIPENYELDNNLIGKGAHGEVQLLIDLDNPDEMRYVVKTVKANDARRDRHNKIRELEILRKVGHPRIVPFYGFILSKFKLQLFLGYMKLGSLTHYISVKGAFDEVRTKHFTTQILEGVSYLHNHKPIIIHRDIKGENILLEDETNCKLADFGVSKILSELTNARTTTGTYNYMAPETFIAGQTYDVMADIWSVGCTVFEMMTSKVPFESAQTAAELIKLIDGGARPDYDVTNCSPKLKNFWDRCFKKVPSERPSADELLKDDFLKQTTEN